MGTSRNAWKGYTDPITVTSDAAQEVVTVGILDGAEYGWFEFATSADNGLKAFEVAVKPHSDASFHTLASAASDFTTGMQAPILGADQDFTTMVKSTPGLLWMGLKGLFQIKFSASAATVSDAVITARWQLR